MGVCRIRRPFGRRLADGLLLTLLVLLGMPSALAFAFVNDVTLCFHAAIHRVDLPLDHAFTPKQVLTGSITFNPEAVETASQNDSSAIPDWFSWDNQHGSIAVADLDGDGSPELIIMMVDGPDGQNRGLFRIGKKLDANGNVTGGWTPWIDVPDWFSWENQGGAWPSSI